MKHWRKFRAIIILFALSHCLTSCVHGYLYQDITIPFDRNMEASELATLQGRASAYRIKEPFSGASMSVEWKSFGLADAMKDGGIEQALIVDVRKQSALFGIWRRDTLIVNGRANALEEIQ